MVYIHSSISVCNSVDQPRTTIMAQSHSINSADLHLKNRNNKKFYTSPSCFKFPVCDRSQSAAVDVLILIAVITACGFLFFPYIKFIIIKLVQIFSELSCLAKEEIFRNPIVYGSIALSICCAAVSAWVILLLCATRRCGNPNCKGLRKAAEFDIQLETEDCVKNSNNANLSGGNNKRGLFELHRDHHRELEAELRKMAPPNGRAVLVFRAKCGCSVGRLEVLGPKKQRKIKK